MRSLRYLHLELDVSDMSLRDTDSMDPGTRRTEPSKPGDPSFDNPHDNGLSEWNIGPAYRSRNAHVRRLIVNCAIDRNLACDIFEAISTMSPDWCPLNELTIKIRAQPDFTTSMVISGTSYACSLVHRESSAIVLIAISLWLLTSGQTNVHRRIDAHISLRGWMRSSTRYGRSGKQVRGERCRRSSRPRDRKSEKRPRVLGGMIGRASLLLKTIDTILSLR